MSATVLSIMNECAVVPRGALIKNANGLVYENKMFEGKSSDIKVATISKYISLTRCNYNRFSMK